MHCMLVPLTLIHFDKCPLIICSQRWERGRGGESLRQTDRSRKRKRAVKEKNYRQIETEVLLQSFVFSRLSCNLTSTISPQLDQQYPRLNCKWSSICTITIILQFRDVWTTVWTLFHAIYSNTCLRSKKKNNVVKLDSETNTLLLIMEEHFFLAKNHLLSKCMLLLTLLLVMYAILIQSFSLQKLHLFLKIYSKLSFRSSSILSTTNG